MAQLVKLTYRIAKRVSALGNQHGFTVKTLANHAGVSTSTIYGILNSGVKPYNPKIGTVEKLAKAFKINMAEFFVFRKPTTVRRNLVQG